LPDSLKVINKTGKDPLQGVTLERILTELHGRYGWETLAEKVRIRCFKENPSLMSSLKFLRRTPWARAKIERLYLKMIRRHGASVIYNGIKECFMVKDLDPYLKITSFIDYDQPEVRAFAERVCTTVSDSNLKEKAVRLYYAVRDEIRYDPYDLQDSPDALKASTVIKKGSGYCVAKAVVLAAVGRQQGIPSRLGFADVRNHLSTARLRQLMGTDLFLYHGYTEFFLDDKWVKATPAFNLSLCERFQVKPLEFNGDDDSIFHEFNAVGQKHMQYIHDHGSFVDLPFEEIFAVYRRQYPSMFEELRRTTAPDFHEEAGRRRD
jgi:uncharacterized protein (DUF2132 family)